MNVFVLCTGRCGSTTFTRAASHIDNYTTDHEARVRLLGAERFAYPDNHIEADNRLAWLLGRLDSTFGERAFYVHLTRDPSAVARSFDQRWNVKLGIISAYRNGILSGAGDAAPLDVCVDLVKTIDSNIEMFLRDKPLKMRFELEAAHENWSTFWDRIGARGDLQKSLQEWNVAHNATPEKKSIARRAAGRALRLWNGARRPAGLPSTDLLGGPARRL